MRSLLALFALGSATLLTACPLGCGGFSGGDDRVYQRNNTDQLILCDNGGFVVTTPGETLQGTYVYTVPGSAGTLTGYGVEGDTGQVAFHLQDNDDGTVTTPELGAQPWQSESLDQTELDHANLACENLESQAWWTND